MEWQVRVKLGPGDQSALYRWCNALYCLAKFGWIWSYQHISFRISGSNVFFLSRGIIPRQVYHGLGEYDSLLQNFSLPSTFSTIFGKRGSACHEPPYLWPDSFNLNHKHINQRDQRQLSITFTVAIQFIFCVDNILRFCEDALQKLDCMLGFVIIFKLSWDPWDWTPLLASYVPVCVF